MNILFVNVKCMSLFILSFLINQIDVVFTFLLLKKNRFAVIINYKCRNAIKYCASIYTPEPQSRVFVWRLWLEDSGLRRR